MTRGKHGGARPGAGRKPTGIGSVVKRVPLPVLPALEELINQFRELRKLSNSVRLPVENPPQVHLPLFEENVRAGFPSPAAGYVAKQLDLNEHLVRNPAATFFLFAEGDSMRDAGIDDKDMLVVDRSFQPRSGHIVVASVNGDFTVKILKRTHTSTALHPANPAYPVIPFPQGEDDRIVAVVRWIIKKCSP